MYVVKVPGINGLGKTKGCENSGNEILKELKNIHTNEQGRIVDVSLLDLEEIHLDNSNLELTNSLIYKNSLEMFETKPKVVFLGGDHSISYSTVKAFLKLNPSSGLIIFDSHADLMPTLPSPVHEDWLRTLLEKGILDPERVLIVGLQNIDEEERKFLDEYKIKTFLAKDIFSGSCQDVCDSVMEIARNWNNLYVSVDIDAVDPAFAPAVAYPEPGGFSSRELLYFLQRLTSLKNFKAADIVEVIPKKDVNEITVKLAAKILSELM